MKATLYIWQQVGSKLWHWFILDESGAAATALLPSESAAKAEWSARLNCKSTLRVLFTSPGETMSREVA